MKASHILVLDSSTPTLFLGLMQERMVLGHHLEVMDRNHAEFMLPRILSFLKRFNLELFDITDVMVGHGPGSFTGVRLALTLIKTLALLQPLRVFPISTLHLFAYESKVMISLDARSGRRYVGIYQGHHIVMPPKIVVEKDLPSLQRHFPHTKAMSVETALGQPDLILKHLKEMYPQLSPLADVQMLNPLYLKDLL